MTVDQEVTVLDELTCHVATLCKACAVDNVVETSLKDAEQVFACLTLTTVCLFVVATELLLENTVDACALLLLAHLKEVLRILATSTTMLPRRVWA